ncbi:GMC family oxidoreductase [Kordiimonas aquimaris]|uniref:GMC family oxidoreductase n=1 Tax=Kordiimonas aquimaris TaxID=707591 RepID=UPI0021D02ACF|nr:choline dehydrogenase [Kordiimonas aquimaris]
MRKQFDYIVVGGGSAGCALAARLSENSNITVALVEAGKRSGGLKVDVPGLLSKVVPPNPMNWNYWTEPQKHLNNRKLYWPRGKVMGGSSAINGMIYIRGHARDYDEWAQLGCKGWSYDDVLPYFKKSEGSDRPDDPYHKGDGPLKVSQRTSVNPLNEAFLAAGGQMRLPFTGDFNGENQEGVGWFDQTIRNGRRQTTAKTYLAEAAGRENLTIIADTQVQRLTLSGKTVTGVEITTGGTIDNLVAAKEVILCGGAINSPQLLQLSGIGNAEDIMSVGLPLLHELPGVGRNMQDHLDMLVAAHLKQPVSLIRYQSPRRAIGELAKWFMKKPGVLSDVVLPVGAFVKTDKALERPDIQFHILLGMADKPHGFAKPHEHGFGVHVCQLRPRSRGTISLASDNPLVPAKINPNYLADPDDMRVMLAGIKMARQLIHQPALADFIEKEKAPLTGVHLDDEEAMIEIIRSESETIYHPVGSCSMGPPDNKNSVVDPSLKVIGLNGIRVADASIMPCLIGGNTNAPTIMIAEKCADMIKSEL